MSRGADRHPHQARPVAESFGSDPERYDRARPRYPEAMVQRIVRSSPGRDVLDVGCGTGIAARQFRAAGCRVLGVEPDARMADLARRSGVGVEVATFEAWDPAGREFDAIVAGQDSRERPKRRRCCVPEAGWQRSGTRASLRPSWREPPPRSTGGWRPTRRSTLGRSQPWMGTRCCSAGRPTGCEKWADSATRSGGDSIGSGPTPARSGWPSCPRGAPSPVFRRTSWRRCSRASGRPSTRWGAASRCATLPWWSLRRELAQPDPASRSVRRWRRDTGPACQLASRQGSRGW